MNLITIITEFIFGGKAFAENEIAEQLNRIDGGSVNVPDEAIPSGVTPNADANPQEVADAVDNAASGFDFGGMLSTANDTLDQILAPVMEFLNNLTDGNVFLSKLILVSVLTLISIIVIIVMLVIINKCFRHTNKRNINNGDNDDIIDDEYDYKEIDDMTRDFDDKNGSSFNEVDELEDIENLKTVEDFDEEYPEDISKNQKNNISKDKNITTEKTYFKDEIYSKPQDINAALDIFYKVTK